MRPGLFSCPRMFLFNGNSGILFARVKWLWCNNDLHLVVCLRMNGAIPALPLSCHMTLWHAEEQLSLPLASSKILIWTPRPIVVSWWIKRCRCYDRTLRNALTVTCKVSFNFSLTVFQLFYDIRPPNFYTYKNVAKSARDFCWLLSLC